MGARENRVERLLKDEVLKLGGNSYKWVGLAGVPDQIVIVQGHTWFVEVKTVDGAVSPVQQRRHRDLISVGAKVRVVYGDAGVHEFIKEVKHVIKTPATA